MTAFISVLVAPLAALFLVGYLAALLDLADRPRVPPAVRPVEIPAIVKPRVLLLGYHPDIAGGVTAVTRPLLAGMPEVQLLPIKHGYGAKAWLLYGVSLIRLTWALVRIRGPLMAHLIVASRGDRMRGVLPILLCRVLNVPVLAHYHTSRANMVMTP